MQWIEVRWEAFMYLPGHPYEAVSNPVLTGPINDRLEEI